MKLQFFLPVFAVVGLAACDRPAVLKEKATDTEIESSRTSVSETDLQSSGCAFKQRSESLPITLKCSKPSNFLNAYSQFAALEKYKKSAEEELKKSPESAQALQTKLALVDASLPSKRTEASKAIQAAGFTLENFRALKAEYLEKLKRWYFGADSETSTENQEAQPDETKPEESNQDEAQAQNPPVESGHWQSLDPEFLQQAQSVEAIMATIDNSQEGYAKDLDSIAKLALALADQKSVDGKFEESQITLDVAVLVAENLKDFEVKPVLVELHKMIYDKNPESQKALMPLEYRTSLLAVTRAMPTGTFDQKLTALGEIISTLNPSGLPKFKENL